MAALGLFVYLEFNPWLVLVTALVLFMVGIALTNARKGLVLFLLFVPFVDLAKRLLFLVPGATGLEYQWILLLPDLILIGLVINLAYNLLLRRSISYRLGYLDLPILLFFLWSIIDIFNPAGSIIVGLIGFKLFEIYILLYFAAAIIMRTWADLARVFKLTIACALIAATYGFYQALFGFAWFEREWLASGLTELAAPGTIALYGIARIFSTFASHEQFGFYLSFAGIFTIAMLPVNKPSGGLILTYIVGALLRTLSRASWLTFLVGATSSFLLLQERRRRLLYTGLLAFSLIISFLVITQVISRLPLAQNPFMERALTTGTYAARINTIRGFLQDPSYYKIAGNGTGMMWAAWRTGAVQFQQVSHIGLIDISYELGLVGLTLFLWFIWRFLRVGWQRIRQVPPGFPRRATIAMYSIIIGILIANAVATTVLPLRPVQAYLWLLLGTLSRADRLGSRGEVNKGSARPGDNSNSPPSQ